MQILISLRIILTSVPQSLSTYFGQASYFIKPGASEEWPKATWEGVTKLALRPHLALNPGPMLYSPAQHAFLSFAHSVYKVAGIEAHFTDEKN